MSRVRGVALWLLLSGLLLSCGPSADSEQEDGSSSASALAVDSSNTEPFANQSATPTPRIPNAPSAEVLRRIRTYTRIEPLGDLQESFGVAPALIPPGPIETTLLGSLVELDLEEWWRLEFAVPGRFDLAPPENALDAAVPRLSFLRPLGWFADRRVFATQGSRPGDDPLFGPNEIERWITEHAHIELREKGQLPNGVRWWSAQVLSGGRNGCGMGRTCIPLTIGGGEISWGFVGSTLRIYELDNAEEPVVALVLAEGDGSSSNFLDEAESLIKSATVGDPAPHPAISSVLAWTSYTPEQSGYVQVSAIPGLRVYATAGNTLWQSPGALSNERVSLSRPIQPDTGELFDSIEDVVAALEENTDGMIATRVGSEAAFGRPATVLAIRGGPSSAILQVPVEAGDPLEYGQWLRSEHALVWVVESPIGPLLYSVGGSSDVIVDTRAFELRANLSVFDFPCAATDSCAEFR